MGDMLSEALQFDYKPRFAADAVFFFMDTISKEALIKTLNQYRERLEVVYSHHRHHYLAEVRWLSDTIDRLVAKGSDISS